MKTQRNNIPSIPPRLDGTTNDWQETLESITKSSNKIWADQLCEATENGSLKWDLELYGRFLRAKNFHKIRQEKSNSIKYIHIKDYCVVEAHPDYIKNYVLKFLNEYGSETIKDALVKNNIFFSQQLMDHLRERIPYNVYEDCEEFLLEEGALIVKEDEMYITRLY